MSEENSIRKLTGVIKREQQRAALGEHEKGLRAIISKLRSLRSNHDPETIAKNMVESPYVVDPEVAKLLERILPKLSAMHPELDSVGLKGSASSGAMIVRRAVETLTEGKTDIDPLFFIKKDLSKNERQQLFLDFDRLINEELSTNGYDLPSMMSTDVSLDESHSFLDPLDSSLLDNIISHDGLLSLLPKHLAPAFDMNGKEITAEKHQLIFSKIASLPKYEQKRVVRAILFHRKNMLRLKHKHVEVKDMTSHRIMVDDQEKDTKEEKDIYALQTDFEEYYGNWLLDQIKRVSPSI